MPENSCQRSQAGTVLDPGQLILQREMYQYSDLCFGGASAIANNSGGVLIKPRENFEYLENPIPV